MPMIRCPVCNQTYDVESSLIGQIVRCAVCNKSFVATPQTIYVLQQQPPVVQPAQRNRGAYIAWAFFLGHLGFHDFYAEKHLLGFIHLGLSFLSGIASAVMRESCPEAMIVSYIWAIVEIFAIKKDGKGIPLK